MMRPRGKGSAGIVYGIYVFICVFRMSVSLLERFRVYNVRTGST